MARPVSDEELQFKKRARRRLVGAIVLVSVAAVVLPMVLDSEPTPVTQNIDIQIPSPEASKPKTAAAPASPPADEGKAAPPERATPAPAPRAEPETPPTIVAESPPPRSRDTEAPPAEEVKKPPAEEAKKAPPSERGADSKKSAGKEAPREKAAASVPTSPGGAFAVQVAALSDARKVKALEKQMAGAGLKTYTEVITTGAGQVTRVRAGPFASREAAEKARDQLKKVGLDGKIVAK